MLKTIALILAAAIAALLIYAATKPDRFRVERSIRINAPPEKIFALINDLHRWDAWSPYEKKDRAIKKTFGGVESGRGATYAWDGDKTVGKGQMEILESTPSSKIVIKLDFIEPFAAHNTAEFLLAPEGNATTVTWAIHGPSPFFSKVMGLFFNMDQMIGKDFETGLADLKTVAER